MKFYLNRETKGFLYLICVALIMIGFAIYGFSKLFSKDEEGETEDPINRIVFVLKDNESKFVYFTDVLVYYPESKRGFVVDVPGNTGAIYKSLNRVDRIDIVYKEKGIDSYRNEIAGLLGFQQEDRFDYIEMSISDFAELTDLLGGLKVFVPVPVDVTGENGERWLLPSGTMNLDGDKLRTYLEYVDDTGKYESYDDRKKNVFVSFLNALSRNKQYIAEESRFGIYEKRLRSNLEHDDLLELLQNIASGDFENLKPMSITGKTQAVEGAEGKLLLPEFNGQDIKRVVKLKTTSLVSSMGADQSRIYVLEILNGTEIQGLAHNTAVYYRGAGYDVLRESNADRNDYKETVIINHIGQEDIAQNVGNYIRCKNIINDEIKPEDDDSASNVDFTIILGSDFDGRYVTTVNKK